MDSAIGIIFNQSKKKILLVKRRDIPVWAPPGGLVEKKETPEAAVVREVYEETRYKTKILKKVAVYTYGVDKKDHLYNCVIVSGKAKTGAESKEIKFFDLKKLPRAKHPFLSKWINDTLKNQRGVIKEKTPDISWKFILRELIKHPVIVFRFLLVKAGIRINA